MIYESPDDVWDLFSENLPNYFCFLWEEKLNQKQQQPPQHMDEKWPLYHWKKKYMAKGLSLAWSKFKRTKKNLQKPLLLKKFK